MAALTAPAGCIRVGLQACDWSGKGAIFRRVPILGRRGTNTRWHDPVSPAPTADDGGARHPGPGPLTEEEFRPSVPPPFSDAMAPLTELNSEKRATFTLSNSQAEQPATCYALGCAGSLDIVGAGLLPSPHRLATQLLPECVAQVLRVSQGQIEC